MGIAKHTSVESITFEEMLKGNSWIMSGDFVLAAGTSFYFHIKTGNLDVIITDVAIFVDGAEVLTQGLAESTVSADGTPIDLSNANRRINGQPRGTGIYSAPTVTDEGKAVLHMVAYGDTQGIHTEIAGSSSGDYYLLARNTSNLFKMVNRDGAASAKISYRIKFLETDYD